MPALIPLSKQQLRELARIFILANTPISFFNSLVRCSAMENLRRAPPAVLMEYFDELTTRARRTDLLIALAYAVLTAILLRARDAQYVPVQASRLHWGERIRVYAQQTTVGTHVLSAEALRPQPTVRIIGSPSENIRGIVLDVDGNPINWRE